MSTSKRLMALAIGTVVALIGAGVASAQVDDASDDRTDTQLHFSYDVLNHLLLINASPTDGTYDCTPPDGELEAGYGDLSAGSGPVESLTHEGEQVTFAPRPADELGEGVEPAEDPIAYDDPDNPCTFRAGLADGPTNQINHGQIVKAFHRLLGMKGHGCLTRFVARSDLGKSEQQIKTGDADPGFLPGDTGTVEFETALADCEHGKKDKPGHPADAATNKAAKGNSANAPGRNK